MFVRWPVWSEGRVTDLSLVVLQGTISQYFVTSDCLVCERQTKQPVCSVCQLDPQLVAVTLASRSAAWEAVHDHLAQVGCSEAFTCQCCVVKCCSVCPHLSSASFMNDVDVSALSP